VLERKRISVDSARASCSCAACSDRPSASESAFDIVPPSDLIFAQFPAKINDATVSDVWKITQTDIKVLDDHSQRLDHLCALAEFHQLDQVLTAAIRSTVILGVIARFLNFGIEVDKLTTMPD
jgi:hypothetical protein